MSTDNQKPKKDLKKSSEIKKTKEVKETAETIETTKTKETLNFFELGLSEELLQAIADSGYTEPSPIQLATIPHVKEGRDVLGQAQTGTGKTAAFALPTLDLIDPKNNNTQVLVLAPTRELALQVARSYETYAKYKKGINIVSIYGGQDYKVQLTALRKGAHIVVGTPGRVIDHINRKTLKLDNIKTMILDEADEMLRMGFIDDVEWVLEKTPESRQITLFSATMPYEIKKITKKHLVDPVEVKIKNKTETASTIKQKYITVKPNQKMPALLRILEAEDSDGVIIFTRTKAGTVDLTEFLESHGLRAVAINGDLQQKQRERAISQLKSGKLDILVATDVAARGLDVERISHVINYDLPQDNETYVHRIGRTGRAGRTGTAILFTTPRTLNAMKSIERTTKQKIEAFEMPTIDDINKQRIAKFNGQITRILEKDNNDRFVEIISDYCNENEADPLIVAAALAKVAQGRKPLLLSKSDIIDISFTSNERSDRSKPKEARRGKKTKSDNSNMQAYRIAVGRNDNVKPGNIVGAIANESGIEGGQIGQIDIYDTYSTVFLPKGMTKDTLSILDNVYVAGKALRIKETTAATKETENSSNRDKPTRRRKPQTTRTASSDKPVRRRRKQ